MEPIPKLRKKFSDVPNKIGLPGASNLPTSSTNSYSTSLFTAWSLFTPLIASISTFVMGCLYAIIDNAQDNDYEA